MKNQITFEVRLPKGVRIEDITVGSIPLDKNWEVTVRENHRNIDVLSLEMARRKYG